jgi:hypothetical protein
LRSSLYSLKKKSKLSVYLFVMALSPKTGRVMWRTFAFRKQLSL